MTMIRHGPADSLPFAVPLNVGRGREERKSIERKTDLGHVCKKFDLTPGIPQKTRRVRVELNSDHREGSVAIGSNAIRVRLRELENILVLVQIKDKNWTNYDSNLQNLRSFSEPIDDADNGNADDNRSVTLYYGIPQKTGRVRIKLNSDQREGCVATGPTQHHQRPFEGIGEHFSFSTNQRQKLD
jgi:hypothetical protein